MKRIFLLISCFLMLAACNKQTEVYPDGKFNTVYFINNTDTTVIIEIQGCSSELYICPGITQPVPAVDNGNYIVGEKYTAHIGGKTQSSTVNVQNTIK